MQINGVHFSVAVMDILVELKSQLNANGVQLYAKMFDSGDDIMVCCPYHKGGQERRPSAGIRKSDGLFHCLACGKTVGIDELIANSFGRYDPAWGYQWLTQNFLTVEVSNREPVKINVERNNFSNKSAVLGYNNTNQPNVAVSEEELEKYRYTHEYMYKRGLNDSVIDLFDIGYDVESDSITFPVKDSTGNCLFVARRSVSNKRFDLPKGIDKPLYGIWEIACRTWLTRYEGQFTSFVNVDKIYVCEGLFDCLRLWCNGKLAVAGFGCLFSEYQLEQLRGLPTRHLVLATDNDDAGREARVKIRQAVKNKLITEAIIPEGKKDIGECTDEEIQNLQEVFN